MPLPVHIPLFPSALLCSSRAQAPAWFPFLLRPPQSPWKNPHLGSVPAWPQAILAGQRRARLPHRQSDHAHQFPGLKTRRGVAWETQSQRPSELGTLTCSSAFTQAHTWSHVSSQTPHACALCIYRHGLMHMHVLTHAISHRCPLCLLRNGLVHTHTPVHTHLYALHTCQTHTCPPRT